MRRRKKTVRYSAVDLSFSCSFDPVRDFRESITEMVTAVGVRSWEEMEELVYCYVALNPPDLHGFIADAFCSVCSCRQRS
ncbi:unnamed protein product [Spirodela intermedia]|uniref:Transcription repressor n=1 Tax=Spirodela intermedia TaxID=51605 RepID=A0A7I8IJX0_SPIIN|nr:unnamed protein product [Spirodela intermedia]CAA6658176.1 unnamed protein product [Spirodela intermedia]